MTEHPDEMKRFAEEIWKLCQENPPTLTSIEVYEMLDKMIPEGESFVFKDPITFVFEEEK